MGFGPTVLLLAALTVPQPADTAGVLLEGAVRIVLYPSYARIISLYSIERNGTELHFDAMRARGQLIRVAQVSGQGLDPQPRQMIELRRLVAPADSEDHSDYRIVYTVSGDLSRLPLFVPNTRVEPGRTDLHIEIVGHGDGIELPAGDPQFHAAGEGLLVARPPTLPEFITLPRPGGDRPDTRRVGWVLIAALLVIGFAIVRRLRGSRRA